MTTESELQPKPRVYAIGSEYCIGVNNCKNYINSGIAGYCSVSFGGTCIHIEGPCYIGDNPKPCDWQGPQCIGFSNCKNFLEYGETCNSRADGGVCRHRSGPTWKKKMMDYQNIKSSEATPTETKCGYESLLGVLNEAYEQVAFGKGKERHANGKPFEQQRMIVIDRAVGGGFCRGQAIKKIEESQGQDVDGAVVNLLGAINYIAGEIIRRREGVQDGSGGPNDSQEA